MNEKDYYTLFLTAAIAGVSQHADKHSSEFLVTKANEIARLALAYVDAFKPTELSEPIPVEPELAPEDPNKNSTEVH